MRLTSFGVQKYRSITKTHDLPCDSPITTLVGPNNEGKSNILRALVYGFKILQAVAGHHRLLLRPSNYGLTVPLHRTETDRELRYDWERDFPLSLQECDSKGHSLLTLEFQLTAKEHHLIRKMLEDRKMGTLRVRIRIYADRAAIEYGEASKLAGPQVTYSVVTFITSRIECQYIPSVRTADSARRIVEELVARELSVIEKKPEFQRALNKIDALQTPVLKEMSKSITRTLREFLPSVKKVKIEIPKESRSRALRRSCNISVNDGADTNLQHKGDGVQSLAALSLMRYASMLSAQGKQILLAVEEPETHLHPHAIHQLKSVLQEIASKHQVILTTHNPLFVTREVISSNIIVTDNEAAPAPSMEAIRQVLGVRPTDNLRHAELVLVVEGEDDRIALRSLLGDASGPLSEAIASETLVLETLLGSSKLSFKLDQLRATLCPFHCFLDHDDAGREAAAKAEAAGFLKPVDVTFAICKGMKDSEIEDMFRMQSYAAVVRSQFGVNVDVKEFRSNKKWAERMKSVFASQGKQWNDQVKAQLKDIVANAVAKKPKTALIAQKRSAFDALAATLVSQLKLLRSKAPVT